MNRVSRKHRQLGSQLVEFALVLPLLLILLFLVTEGAGLIRAHQVLNNAVREGARIATVEYNKPSLPGGDCDAACVNNHLKQAVVDYGVRNGLPSCSGDRTPCFGTGNVTVDQDCQYSMNGAPPSTCVQGSCPSSPCQHATRVTATYAYKFTYLPAFLKTDNTMTLQSQSVFRNLYSSAP